MHISKHSLSLRLHVEHPKTCTHVRLPTGTHRHRQAQTHTQTQLDTRMSRWCQDESKNARKGLMSHWSACSEESSPGDEGTDWSGGHGTHRHGLVQRGEPLTASGDLQDNWDRVRREVARHQKGESSMGRTWNCDTTCAGQTLKRRAQKTK